MNIIQIVFGPVARTQKAVDSVTEEWSGSVQTIDLSDSETDYSKIRIALIAVLPFGGRVTALAMQGSEKIQGNRAYEDPLVELKEGAEKSGFRVITGVSAIAEHSIEKEWSEFARKIFAKGSQKDPGSSKPWIPGNRPYKKAGGGGTVLIVNHKRNKCGSCARKCSAQPNSREDLKAMNSKKCISRMRCAAICPQSARKVDSVMAAAGDLKKSLFEQKGKQTFSLKEKDGERRWI